MVFISFWSKYEVASGIGEECDVIDFASFTCLSWASFLSNVFLCRSVSETAELLVGSIEEQYGRNHGKWFAYGNHCRRRSYVAS